ncbi:MAG: phage tail protein [Chloroflexi bacterium]|nr:phage tail protein [Chloroflexota bacterium]
MALSKERSFLGSHYALQLENVTSGFLQSVEGGHATADVVTERSGADFFVRKHLGPLKYEDINLQCGLAAGQPFLDWVSAFWNRNFQRKNGAIVTLDYKLSAVSAQEFFNALITEIGFPACDASNKEPSFLMVKIKPEYTRTKKISGRLKIPPQNNGKKAWLTSNFRLNIAGLDCTKVFRIDAFTVRHLTPESETGDHRDYEQLRQIVEFPNLRITFTASVAQSWHDWFEDFVIQGNCAEDRERSGTLELLSPDLQSVLMRVQFANLGIFRLAPKPAKDPNQSERVTADLYCQQMSLEFL